MRIKGLDVARAFAILGMMLINYKIVFCGNDITFSKISGVISIFEGRAAAVFLVLSGIGLKLMTKGKEYDQSRIKKSIFKRALFLLVLGILLYVAFDWSADILHYYGIYMIMVIPLLFLDREKLMSITIAILAISLFMQVFLNYTLGWDETMTSYTDFYSVIGFMRNTFFNGYHPVFPWFSFILIGLIIGNVSFDCIEEVKKYLLVGILIAVITEVCSWITLYLFGNEMMIYFFDTKPMNPSVFYVIASSAWAVAFIMLCVYLVDHLDFAKNVHMFSPTGQMALTHYVGHSIVVLGIVEALGLLKMQNEIFVLILTILIFTMMVIFSVLWKRKYNHGPLEGLMRRFSS